MRLPRGRLHEFLQRNAARPFQQIEDFGRFAAGLGRNGGFLAASGLSGRLGLDGRRLCAPFPGTGLRGGAAAVSVGSCGIEVVILMVSPLSGNRRVMTSVAPFGPAIKSFLEKRLEKLPLAIPPRLARDLA